MWCFVIRENAQGVHVAIKVNGEYSVLVACDAIRSVR